jgi:oxygen-independent coproporphyrinogen III oxidase
MLGLYVHIPFCKKRCHYCNFVVTTANKPASHEAFLEALEKESAHARAGFEGRSFDTLYVGGGTPSMLSVEETYRFFEKFKKSFTLKPNAEITWEVNPGDFDFKKAAAYKDCGINRISMGVQSFHEGTLQRLNRSHGVREIFKSFEILKKAGFENISLDLILSLPGENLEDVKHSLEHAVSLKPQHVSLYELVIEEKTVLGQNFKKGKLKSTDESVQLEMLSYARGRLKEAGFIHYELLSYARPGFESRHNQIYWSNEAYLGLGPGATSYLDGKRFCYTRTVEEYLEKVRLKDWNNAEEETLTADKKETESFLLALRLKEGADLRRFPGVIEKSSQTLADLKEKGLLEEREANLFLTPQGQLFAETVFAELSLP